MATKIESRERSVFLAALEIPEPEARLEWVRERCGSDTDLLVRIVGMLKSHAKLGSFLEPVVTPSIEVPSAAAGAVDTASIGSVNTSPDGDQSADAFPPAKDLTDFLAPCDIPGAMGLLDGFEVMSILGRGGMGIVLKAFDPKLSRDVAIKVMSPELAAAPGLVERFQRESRLAAAVRHDHIVTVYSVGEWRGRPYLVMECVEGCSLNDRLKQDGRLAPEEVIRIGRQLASGLAAAHASGLVAERLVPCVERVRDRALDDRDHVLGRQG